MDTIADQIAVQVLRGYDKLPRSAKPNKNTEWTLLAGILLQIDSNFSLISLGTGSKCLNHTEMSQNGNLLNDSHAEIMARRGLLRYIYSEIRNMHNKGQSTLFSGIDKDNNKCILRDDIQFHMFLSHTPCGDASIENGKSIQEQTDEEPRNKIIKLDDKIQRTGAKLLPGNIETWDEQITGKVRIKPGHGEPTLSLSCSDKLSRWNVLGMQGALISMLINKSIYLSSIVVASNCQFSQTAMQRAIVNRTSNMPRDIATCFKHNNNVQFLQSSYSFPDGDRERGGRPSPNSAVWVAIGKGELEIAVKGRREGITKNKLNTPVACLKICKLKLLNEFLGIVKLLMDKNQCIKEINEPCWETLKSNNYLKLKSFACDYQSTWQLLKEHCFKDWTSKPENLNHFCASS